MLCVSVGELEKIVLCAVCHISENTTIGWIEKMDEWSVEGKWE